MYKIILILLIILFSGGCSPERADLDNYRCSPKQLELVEKETDICMKTDYYSLVCFRNAKISLCNKIKEEE